MVDDGPDPIRIDLAVKGQRHIHPKVVGGHAAESSAIDDQHPAAVPAGKQLFEILVPAVDRDKPDVVHPVGNGDAPQSRIEHIVQYGSQVAYLPVIVEPVVGILLPADEAHV